MSNTAHDFLVGDIVEYTPEWKGLFASFDEARRYDGTFTVKAVKVVPLADYDPFSSDYMGECAGREAVGHHQLVTLEGHDGEVSGKHLQPV